MDSACVSLDGEVVVVTGGSRGQGAAEARLFAERGACVVIADVLDDEGALLAEELGDRATYCHLDVADEAQWGAVIATANSRFDRVTVLVNNAGILESAPILDTTMASFTRQVEVNLLGVFLGVRAAARDMVPANRGSIVNVSSTGGLKATPGHVAYCATKFGVRGITRVAATEFGPLGVRVNCVHPGLVDTPMFSEVPAAVREDLVRRTPIGRPATAREIAQAVVFLASAESSYMNGAEVTVDGGMLA